MAVKKLIKLPFSFKSFISNSTIFSYKSNSSSTSSAALASLDFRRVFTLASNSALTVILLMAFLLNLRVQTIKSVWDRSHITGRANGLLIVRLRCTISDRLQLESSFLHSSNNQVLISLLWGHSRQACSRLSLTPDVQSVHAGLSFILSRKSLSFVGSMLCNILNKKLVWSELSPLSLVYDQDLSQSTSGLFSSNFAGLHVRGASTGWGEIMVTCFSTKTLYHCLVVILETLRRPSVTTSLIEV